jgi:predicted phosphodiesterase
MSQRFQHAVVFGDTHYPFQDDATLSVVKRVIADVRPDVLIHIGDLVDCWQISRFDKDPARRESLQTDIDRGAALLKELYALTPDARRFYLEGNHEQRLQRTICNMQDKAREIAGLRVFQKYINWPTLLDDAGVPPGAFEFVPTRGQARRRIFPKLVVKHGSIVSKWSGATAKAEWMRYGMSGVSGHTHRLGVFYHRDFNGAHGWAETGCTCDLMPEYVEDPDWQHGCLVIAFAKDFQYFAFEPVYIQEGSAIWREHRYRLKGKSVE